MADRELDAAVDDFAARFRAALDPPAQAGVTMDRGAQLATDPTISRSSSPLRHSTATLLPVRVRRRGTAATAATASVPTSAANRM